MPDDTRSGSRGLADSPGSSRPLAACDSSVGRRGLLKLGAAGVAGALAGCFQDGTDDVEPDDGPPDDAPPGDDGPPEDDGADDGVDETEIPYADEYDRVVDLVADAGADPEGETSILPALEAAAGDDTLVYVPPGRYLMDDLWAHTEFERLAVVGEDATIVPQSGYFGYMFVFGVPERRSSDLLFEGFEFDFTAADTAPRPIQVQIDDGLVVRDVVARGISGTARFDVTATDGEGLVRNLRLPDGGMEPNPVGVLVGPANRGTLRFEDCHVEGFPGNGLYASPSNGPVEVEGGLYANNGIASVRVSSPATVRGVTVRCDRAPEGFRNMRGIRLRHGDSVLVEDCTVELTDLTYSDGAIVVEPMMESATIRDVTVECSVDEVPAVNARSPRDQVGERAVECDRVRVTGDASRGAAVWIVDRDQCVLDTVSIDQTGEGRDGVHLVRSDQSVLRDCQIDVTGEPVVLEQSHVRTVNSRL